MLEFIRKNLGQKITHLSSLLKIFIFLIGLLLLSGCSTELHSHLSQREAIEIISTLSRANIHATHKNTKDNFYSVHVDEADYAKALAILGKEGLPKKEYNGIANVFKGEGFVQSKTEEHARLSLAISEELKQSIEKIPGIDEARVHINLPRSVGNSREITQARAAVYIYAADIQYIKTQTSLIKKLLLGSIENIDASNISIGVFPSHNQYSVDEMNKRSTNIVGSIGSLSAIIAKILFFSVVALALLKLWNMDVRQFMPNKRENQKIGYNKAIQDR